MALPVHGSGPSIAEQSLGLPNSPLSNVSAAAQAALAHPPVAPSPGSWEARGFRQSGDGWVKEYETVVWRRGKRYRKIETLKVLGSGEKVYRHLYNFFGAACGGAAQVVTFGSVKSVKKFVDERCNEMREGVKIENTRYEPIDQHYRPNIDLDLGYNPDDPASLDAAWTGDAPEVFPKADEFGMKRKYEYCGHQFIYMGKGHILFAPNGDSNKSRDVSFYNEESGKAWKNGKNLKEQIDCYVRNAASLKKMLNPGEKYIALDLEARKVWVYAAEPDFNTGFKETNGRELFVNDAFWRKRRPKSKEKQVTAKLQDQDTKTNK